MTCSMIFWFNFYLSFTYIPYFLCYTTLFIDFVFLDAWFLIPLDYLQFISHNHKPSCHLFFCVYRLYKLGDIIRNVDLKNIVCTVFFLYFPPQYVKHEFNILFNYCTWYETQMWKYDVNCDYLSWIQCMEFYAKQRVH